VTVLAGSLQPGYVDGAGENIALNFPQHICQPDANTLLIADRSNGRVRKLNLKTLEMVTMIGCGDMDYEKKDGFEPVAAADAHLFSPSGVTMDPVHEGCILLGVDDYQRCIRRYNPADDSVNVVAGQIENMEPEPEDEALLHEAWNKACLAGHVAGEDALFSDVACLLSAQLKGQTEKLVYISCMASHIIRSFNPETHEVKRVVGNGRQGPCEQGSLEDPFGLAVDSQGRLLIACLEGYTILRYDPTLPEGQNLVRLAGQSGQRWFRDGHGDDEALLGDVAGLATDKFDTVYFCDYAHGAIRAISPEGFVYTLVCADPQYTNVAFSFAAPFGLHFDAEALERGEPRLFVTDFHRVLQIDLDYSSFPIHGPETGRRMLVTPLGMHHPAEGSTPAPAKARADNTKVMLTKGRLTKSMVGRMTPSAAGRLSASAVGRATTSAKGRLNKLLAGTGGVKAKPPPLVDGEDAGQSSGNTEEDDEAKAKAEKNRTSMSGCALM